MKAVVTDRSLSREIHLEAVFTDKSRSKSDIWRPELITDRSRSMSVTWKKHLYRHKSFKEPHLEAVVTDISRSKERHLEAVVTDKSRSRSDIWRPELQTQVVQGRYIWRP